MKYNHIITACLLLCAVASCDDTKVEYVDSTNPDGLVVNGLENNQIEVYTGGQKQVEIALLPGDKEYPNIKDSYVFTSSDKKIFTVSNAGVVTGKGVGEGVLTISSKLYPGRAARVMVRVTDEYFFVKEILVPDAFKNYTMAPGASLNLGDYISVLPANASDKSFAFRTTDPEIVEVSEDGIVKANSLGTDTITILAAEQGGEAFTELIIEVKAPTYQALDRTEWKMDTSIKYSDGKNYVPDGSTGKPEDLLDGKANTFLSLVKPTKTAGYTTGGVTYKPEPNAPLFFVADTQSETTTFDYVRFGYRTSNTNLYLRPYGFSIYGSNDGTDFELILGNVDAQPASTNVVFNLPLPVSYRYVRIVFTDWDTKNGSTIQLAEFDLGNTSFE
ncbi:MAG: Ig-like domain-containing protein [Mediterranea sp.]|jgi:hypothetical protein|nr:Ig-like domain-containing protein [Mediterranea sp.]